MDLVAACRALVAVSARGSFTAGAAQAGVPQPVASRRIAALEQHLGARLLDRSTRAVAPTAFGRDVLPAARRLIEAADALLQQAGSARVRPLGLAVPDTCPQEELVRLVAEAFEQRITLRLHRAGPAERAELAQSRQVRVAVVAAPADEATWQVPLGLASGAAAPPAKIHLDTLREGRLTGAERRRRVWLQPEDDVPHVRDRLLALGDAAGLQPVQVAVADSVVTAAAQVLTSEDLLLCSRRQARDLHLPWSALGEGGLRRGYRLAGAEHEDLARVASLLGTGLGACLGATGQEPPRSAPAGAGAGAGTGATVDR
ncbi:LysR family transcriptional regulator [Kineococcus sp. T13]|uniref:LysR family transcriptional regulator n=1 Tax=Kineococcus vitellinus TaxID=2696565 RepID=UPI001413770D|nr:LysR family transcriptional regulator [Kineococcus vitellinus]